MNCPNCGTQNSDHAKFCLECGISINQELSKSQLEPQFLPPIVNPSRGVPFRPSLSERDEVNVVVYCCAACIPIAGFVLYFTLKDNKPESAQNVLILSFLSFGLIFFLGIFS